ncbi:MBOAT family O-acyltransferase [Alkaliphilus sp. B6464]|uniref:MBOAT family O-acyltransferase n=1 Tax=Alkaliphilus sp. B6464 TaxID=2731219 RepID=UPI0020110558|nr:MBOAT family O-acyltransferase [Alkaliphilus sp. B6464]
MFIKNTANLSIIESWIGIICYSLQIYFDFSGYSDMAIGLGKLFGFDFLENFNYPYISQSASEFWRRWHISLGSWFRDYVYIPLGGNRVYKIKSYMNLFIVWFLTGLWHGANWAFIIWGLYYGVLIILEKAFLEKLLRRLPKILRHIYLLLIVVNSPYWMDIFQGGQYKPGISLYQSNDWIRYKPNNQ